MRRSLASSFVCGRDWALADLAKLAGRGDGGYLESKVSGWYLVVVSVGTAAEVGEDLLVDVVVAQGVEAERVVQQRRLERRVEAEGVLRAGEDVARRRGRRLAGEANVRRDGRVVDAVVVGRRRRRIVARLAAVVVSVARTRRHCCDRDVAAFAQSSVIDAGSTAAQVIRNSHSRTCEWVIAVSTAPHGSDCRNGGY